MLSCVQAWLKHKKITDYKTETIALKRIYAETSQEFFEYAETLPVNEWMIIKDIYNAYLNYSGLSENDLKPSIFGKYLNKYAKYKGYEAMRKNIKGKGRFVMFKTLQP